jgi:hypothetical protein
LGGHEVAGLLDEKEEAASSTYLKLLQSIQEALDYATYSIITWTMFLTF